VIRTVLPLVACLAVGGVASAQCCSPVVGVPVMTYSAQPMGVTATAPTGLLSRLNQPFFPGQATNPWLPTPSPLGLISPRLSFFSTFRTDGGFGNLPATLPALVGFAAPRGSIIGLFQDWPPSSLRIVNAGLGVASPRIVTGLQIIRGFRQSRSGVGSCGCQ